MGALTSGTYRYQTRPWEMTHVGTICTHCGDGCKTTLGTRNDQIIRGNNRDRSGINGEFLCIKGRYAFDFYDHPERLQSPLVRVNGKLEEVSWAQALEAVAQKFTQTLADGGSFGVIGSNHTTNEENFYLQKFAREVLEDQPHRPPPHRRRGDAARRAERQDRANWPPSPISTSARPSWCSAPIWRWSIPCSATRFAPTTGIIRRTSTR